MSGSGDPSLPLVDQQVLFRLRSDLDEAADYWQVFTRNYLELLATRIQRLRDALTTGDLEGALDATLSLKTSSQMLGAQRLASLCINLESDLRSQAPDHDPAIFLPRLARDFIPGITVCGRFTADRLQSALNS